MSSLPLAPSVSGTYARWLAILSVIGRDPNAGLERLLQIGEGYASLDFLDSVEVDCAILHVMAEIGVTDDDRAARLRGRLATLPIPVSHQLNRLGLLPGGCVADAIPEAVL
jgi:hypothetical protein